MYVYIFEDSRDLENLPLLSIKWTLFLQFCFLGDLLKLRFLLHPSIFITIDEENEEQKSTIFEGCYLNLMEKKLEIHEHSWRSIIWIFKKLNSIQTLVRDIPEIKLSYWSLLSKTYKKSHSITRTLNKFASSKFVFYPDNCLGSLWILSYWESTVTATAPISSLTR